MRQPVASVERRAAADTAGTTSTPAVRAERSASADTCSAEPLWFFRINPLTRKRLADQTLAHLLGELAETEHAVHTAAHECSAEIYTQIGDTADVGRRGQLIALRRAIHNDQEPRSQPDPDAPAVGRWLRARQRRSELRELVVLAYPQAVAAERTTLAGLLGDDSFRRALALVAPEVYLSAERYRAAVLDDGTMSARARKTERGLLQYVTRSMIRTSPLSHFTAVGVAVPDERGLAPDDMPFAPAVAFPGLDRVMLEYVLAGLPTSPADPGPTTWVSVPPTSAVDPTADRLFFLRSTDAGLRRLSTPITAAVRLLLDAAGMGPRQVSSIAQDLAARSGCSAEQAQAILLGALRAGILCTSSGPEDGAADIDSLLTRPGSIAAGLLDEIRVALPRLSTATPEQRPDDLVKLGSALRDLSRVARRPAQIVVQEDCVLPSMRVATSAWRGPLDDLSAGVELLAAFDRLHDVRAIMSATFVERFGVGGDILLVAHATELIDEVYRRATVVHEVASAGGVVDSAVLRGIGPADGSLDRLHVVRREIVETLHAGIDRGHSDHQDVTWPAATARALTDGLPDRCRPDPMAYGVLVQPWRDRLVFNDALPGHGMLYGRFLGADRQLGGEALPYLAARLTEQYGSGSARVVEDPGLYGLNVNAHPQIVDGLRPDDWFTLRLVHDPDTDLLHIQDPEGRRLRVLTLGAGHPGLFPPALRVASCLVTGGRLFEDLIGDWHRVGGWDARLTRACPRLSVGNAVIARRRWYGGDELATAVAAGPAEHDRLLALTRWRGRYRVPAEIVLKTTLDNDGPLGIPEPDADMKAHLQLQKPQYVDLASTVSVRVLPRMVARRGKGYLEEALPAVGDGAHAYEWAVQIDRVPGERLRYGGRLR